MRFARWVPIVLALALAVWAWNLRSPAGAATTRAAPPNSARVDAERNANLLRFRSELERFRGGDETLADGLAELADVLAASGRPDVRDVFAYYRRLTQEERRRGLDGENEHARLWEQVQDARASDVREDEWKDERALIEGELGVLIARSQADADRVPAARALSLRALLAMERVASDPTLRLAELERIATSARDDARDAERIFADAGFLTPQLEPLWIQARVATVLDEPALADALFARCRDVARRVANEEYQRRAVEGMLELAKRTKDTVGELRLVRELAALVDVAEDWPLARQHFDSLLSNDEYELAADFLERHRPEAANDQRYWRIRLANARYRARRFEEARAVLAPDAAGLARAASDPEIALTLALVDVGDGAPQRARDRARLVLANLPPNDPNTPRVRMQALVVLGTALLRAGDAAGARLELANAFAAADAIAVQRRRDADTGAQSNTIGEELGLETVALYADACVRMDRHLEAAVAIERAQAADMRRARVTNGAGTADDPLDETAVARWAGAYEAGLLTWVVGADTTVAVHVAHDGSALGVRVARGRRAIDDAARRLRETAIRGDARTDELAAEIERELVPAPLAARLARAPRGRLLCLVHGKVERLPVETWPLFTEGGLVPVCLPGLTGAERGANVTLPPDVAWQLAGAPVDASGAELLPGARAELEALAALHPRSTLAFGAAFDADALARAFASGAPLHVATHVVSDGCDGTGRLLPSGLELSGGDRMCATELALYRPALPLAFLSACATGDGRFVDALGLQGIALAFLEGGTRNLLVTTWPIEDEAARRFALAYHRALLAGRRPSEAASDARAELRRSGHAPADWAAFRALGLD